MIYTQYAKDNNERTERESITSFSPERQGGTLLSILSKATGVGNPYCITDNRCKNPRYRNERKKHNKRNHTHLLEIAPNITIWTTSITHYSDINICTLKQQLIRQLKINKPPKGVQQETKVNSCKPLSLRQTEQQKQECSQYQQKDHTQVSPM